MFQLEAMRMRGKEYDNGQTNSDVDSPAAEGWFISHTGQLRTRLSYCISVRNGVSELDVSFVSTCPSCTRIRMTIELHFKD